VGGAAFFGGSTPGAALGLAVGYFPRSFYAGRASAGLGIDATLPIVAETVSRTQGATSVRIGSERGLGQVPRAVHGRLGAPCVRCGTPIPVVQANEPPYERPVFWCPACQAPQGADGRADPVSRPA